MVKQVWGKHATVATGTNDTGKQVSVNVWNESLNRKGLLGFDAETIDSAASVTIPEDTSSDSSDGSTSSFIKLAGVTSVDTIVQTNTSEGDLLWVITTGSVTLNDATGNIHLLGDANKDLSTTVPTILMRIGAAWYEYGGSPVTTGSITNAKLANMAANTIKVRNAVDAGVPSDIALATTQLLIGNGTGFTAATLSTDATLANDGTVTVVGSTGNFALGGDLTIAAAQDVDLIDNTADALSFDSTGKAGILKFVTTNDGEGVTMSGTLGVTGAITGTLTGNASGLSATLAVASGGTGSTTTSAARTALGVAIGSDVQAYSANTALTTDKLSDFAATTSAELKGTISDETGTGGALVFATSPALTTPTATQLDILAQGELRLQDDTGGEYVGFKAPTGVTSYTLTLPEVTTATEGYVLKMSSTSNTLEWGSAGGGAVELGEYKYQANGYTTPSYTTRTVNDDSTPIELWVKDIDASGENQGVFIRIKKNDAYEDVQLG